MSISARFALLLLPLAGAAQAQILGALPEPRQFTEEEIAAVAMPSLAFEQTPAMVADYDKYFYFHRPDTSFSEAYADISECDALASGISIYRGADSGAIAGAMAQYGLLAGAVGGAIGSVMADAIFGSAERRKARRLNIRNCMYFKEYDRYGLKKDLWQEFHFEEGLSKTDADERSSKLLMQARIASGPKPAQEALEP